jgi:hypothetical protein
VPPPGSEPAFERGHQRRCVSAVRADQGKELVGAGRTDAMSCWPAVPSARMASSAPTRGRLGTTRPAGSAVPDRRGLQKRRP